MREEDAPYMSLLLAMIERAVIDAVCDRCAYSDWEKENRRNDQISAREWILVPYDDGSGPLEPFTFEWACEQLDICPESIRSFVVEEIKQNPFGSGITNSRVTVASMNQFFRELDGDDSVMNCLYSKNLVRRRDPT